MVKVYSRVWLLGRWKTPSANPTRLLSIDSYISSIITGFIGFCQDKFKDIQEHFNHFSTTGRNCGPPLRDACVRQACLPAIATSSFKIFLTQSFPRRGATCYILPWRAMSRLFNGVNFGYRSADVYRSFQTYLGVLVRIRYFHNGELRWRFDALCFRPFIR